MSFWLVSVPLRQQSSGALVSELANAAGSQARVQTLALPPLKVGTLDQLMALSEDTAKQDTFVGGVAKKIEKTYYEMWKAEAAEVAAQKEREAARAGHSSSSSSAAQSQEKPPELRIGDTNKTAYDYVRSWQWNDVRYPRRSALRLLTDLIVKESSKSDEALKKQVSEYNEVRTQYTALERKEQGTLLVKPLGQYVKQKPVETAHLTTLMLVVPRARKQEFLDTYETMEAQAAQKEKEDAAKKAAEAEERARKDAERQREEEAAGRASKSPAQLAHEAERAREKAEAAEKEAEARRLEAEMQDPKEREQKERERKEREEEEKKKNKKLPPGCNAVVPRSATILCDEPTDEFVLLSVVVLRQGAEHYKNLCRERRFTVRPFTFDPEEDKAERERKVALGQKKRNLWNFLIRWCTTTYGEVFAAWMHLKAIRLYVEGVLRYGLPYSAQGMLLEPVKNKEKHLRETLRALYGNLAGSNANLTTALDPNEPDLSGLGADFYPYVFLSLNISD